MLTKEEFNLMFLASVEGYLPKVQKALITDCRDDIRLIGLERTIEKWALFVGLKYNGKGSNWVRYSDAERLDVEAIAIRIKQ